MKSSALIFFALFVFTVITSVNSVVPFIEDEDEGTARKTVPEKRGYTWSCYRIDFNCRCRANFRCYYNGYYGRKCCGWVYQQPSCPRCQASQCCKRGRCQALRTYLQWCPLSSAAKRYSCGCANGLKCLGGYYYHYGKCYCSSNAACGTSRCCSNNVCKPLRRPGLACPLKGADRFYCGCVQGYECKPAGYGRYWGKCVEESGSGMEA
ncbi:uncharacterized protein LOC141863813 [Acropora palmata]|uniref:uncharacterized protein LOC141863813 n=1 Tax=Acropora palmata TaxID=6131 RepID=UPI003DA0178E